MIELTEQTEFAAVFAFIFLGFFTMYWIDRWLARGERDEEEED